VHRDVGRRSRGRSRPTGDGNADGGLDDGRVVRASELQVDDEHDRVGSDHHRHDHSPDDGRARDRHDHSEYFTTDDRTDSHHDERDRPFQQLH
jgi:hypothetical protein